MPEEFYINTSVTIKAVTDKDLTGATVRELHYKSPDGSTGFWVGAIADGSALVYNTMPDDIDMPGVWTFWPHIEKGSDVWNGKPFKQKFINVGE